MTKTTSTAEIEKVRQDCLALHKALDSRQNDLAEKRQKWHQQLSQYQNMMENELGQFPRFTSYTRRYYEAYKRSFELFSERLALLSNRLAEPLVPVVLPHESDNLNDWLDVFDDLEDVLEKYTRHLIEREDLLQILEILDSVEQLLLLVILVWPKKPKKRQSRHFWHSNALKNLQQIARHISERVEHSLERQGITRIDLRIGEYPSPTETRIIMREDEGQDDNVVVSQIAKNGYRWNGMILREADVIVSTRQE